MLGLVKFDLLVLGIPVNLDFDTPGTLCDISSRQNSKVSFHLCHLCTAQCLGYALGYECPIFFFFFKLSTAPLFPKLYNNIV